MRQPAVDHGLHARRQSATFRVWAPNAARVSVIGEWNGWDADANPLAADADGTGIWEGGVRGVTRGQAYKYRDRDARRRRARQGRSVCVLRRNCRRRPLRASGRSTTSGSDDAWMASRHARNALDAPMSIYEVHLGSWRRDDPGAPADLSRHRRSRSPITLCAQGFTHVEFLPLTEHPFYGSWGYQTTGYFAPTARYGTPQDLMYLIDVLHQRGIGVILDWVPSHFPDDAHGLARFDGTHLYEHADPRQGFHPEWKSLIFNYDRHEVRAFLAVERAVLARRVPHRRPARRCRRVDAVPRLCAQRRRVDPERPRRQGEPRRHRRSCAQLNEAVYRDHPDVQMIAEESTSWPMVSRPAYAGGLGLRHEVEHGLDARHARLHAQEPIHRKHHHDRLTFSIWYAFSENFVLPLSHDEVVYGKGSLIGEDAGRPLAAIREPARAVSATCGRIRARSCCSWAASSRSGANGRTTARSNGACCSIPSTRACSASFRTSTPLPRRAGAA